MNAEWDQTVRQQPTLLQPQQVHHLAEALESRDVQMSEPVADAMSPSSTAQRQMIPSPASQTKPRAAPPVGEITDQECRSTEVTVTPAPAASYLGNSGILQIFARDSRGIAANDSGNALYSFPGMEDDLPPPELQQSFADTYFDYCWPWCPVLDKATFWQNSDATPSALLTNALALLGTQIRPPMMQHATAGEYYNRAKMLFYMDQDSNPIVCLQAIMLFYWWAPRG